MTNNLTRRGVVGLLGLAPFSGATLAQATAWKPSQPVEFVVGFPPGGGNDSYGRAIAAAMASEFGGAPAVVVNRPGAAQGLALSQVRQSPADGHSIFVVSAGSLIHRGLFAKPEQDLSSGMTFLGAFGNLASALFVRAKSPIKSGADWLDQMKAASRPVRWAHSGRQVVYHVAGEALLRRNDLRSRDVPFQGAAEARNALINEEVEFGVFGTQHLAGFEGELRILGVIADQRDVSVPNVPTMAEQGVKCPDVSSLCTLMVRSDTPALIVEALTDNLRQAAASEVYRKSVATAGLPPIWMERAATEEWWRKSTETLRPVIQELSAPVGK